MNPNSCPHCGCSESYKPYAMAPDNLRECKRCCGNWFDAPKPAPMPTVAYIGPDKLAQNETMKALLREFVETCENNTSADNALMKLRYLAARILAKHRDLLEP